MMPYTTGAGAATIADWETRIAGIPLTPRCPRPDARRWSRTRPSAGSRARTDAAWKCLLERNTHTSTCPRTGRSRAAPAGEAHLVGRDEAKSLVQRASLVGRVQHESVEAFGGGPIQHAAHQRFRDTSTAPGRLGEHIDHDAMPPVGDRDAAVRERSRVGQHDSALDPRPPDHGVVVARHG